MIDQTDLHVRYQNHHRQCDWVNAQGWKFASPSPRRVVRETVARALVSLAARLAPPLPTTQPQPRTV